MNLTTRQIVFSSRTIDSQLPAYLEWVEQLRGCSNLVWEMEEIQFVVVKKKRGNDTFHITEKNTALFFGLWFHK